MLLRIYTHNEIMIFIILYIFIKSILLQLPAGVAVV